MTQNNSIKFYVEIICSKQTNIPKIGLLGGINNNANAVEGNQWLELALPSLPINKIEGSSNNLWSTPGTPLQALLNHWCPAGIVVPKPLHEYEHSLVLLNQVVVELLLVRLNNLLVFSDGFKEERLGDGQISNPLLFCCKQISNRWWAGTQTQPLHQHEPL